MARQAPPRYVPTLTEVVQGPPVAPLPVSPADLARQVLQRVDAVLPARVQHATERVIQEHAAALLPLLRERLEAVVHEAVAEALAQELSARGAPPPGP